MARRTSKPRPVFTGVQVIDRPRVVSPIAHAVACGALAKIVEIGWNANMSDKAAASAMWEHARRALRVMGVDGKQAALDATGGAK